MLFHWRDTVYSFNRRLAPVNDTLKNAASVSGNKNMDDLSMFKKKKGLTAGSAH